MLWGAVTVGLAAALVALPISLGGTISPAVIIAAPVMLALASLLLFRDPPPLRKAGLAAALAAAFVLPAGFIVAPSLDYLWPSRSAAKALTRHPAGPGEAVLSVGYSEPSLVFLLGTGTRLITAAPADSQLKDAGMALVNRRYDAEFRQSLAGHGLTARALDRIEGLDYSAGGGRLLLTLYRLEPG